MSTAHHIAAPGIFFALASALLFGASTPLAKLLLGALDPWMLAGLLYLGSGLGLAVLRIGNRLVGYPVAEASLRLPDVPWLAAIVLAGGVTGPVLLMVGLTLTPASTASLLLNLEGLATMGIAWLVFWEHVDRRLVLGALAILGGAILLSWDGGEHLSAVPTAPQVLHRFAHQSDAGVRHIMEAKIKKADAAQWGEHQHERRGDERAHQNQNRMPARRRRSWIVSPSCRAKLAVRPNLPS